MLTGRGLYETYMGYKHFITGKHIVKWDELLPGMKEKWNAIANDIELTEMRFLLQDIYDAKELTNEHRDQIAVLLDIKMRKKS